MSNDSDEELRSAFGFYLTLWLSPRGRAMARAIRRNARLMVAAARQGLPPIFGLDAILAGFVKPHDAPMSGEELRENKFRLRFVGFVARRVLEDIGYQLRPKSYRRMAGSVYFRGGSLYRVSVIQPSLGDNLRPGGSSSSGDDPMPA